jgi:hypothetical protein
MSVIRDAIGGGADIRKMWQNDLIDPERTCSAPKSFDQLVGSQQECLGNFEPERFCRL